MLSELPVGLVMIAPDGGLLEGSFVRPDRWSRGDLATVLDAVLAADTVEHVQSITSCRSGAPRQHVAERSGPARSR
jgi:hypothetical protein